MQMLQSCIFHASCSTARPTDQMACNPVTNYDSFISVQTLAPLFAHYNLVVTKENLTTLIDKIISESNKCMNYYTSPFPRDFYMLDEVKTLRPEYLIGTWFNRKNRPFKVNMELDWVNRMVGDDCFLPETPSLFASTGDNIWDFISEVHIHPTAMMEFRRAMDGWIEAPNAAADWKREADDDPLNFIERVMKIKGGKTVVVLNSGMGGWATFEPVRNSDVTPAAARLLFKFSDPHYCARSDGKVVIKFKEVASRATWSNNYKFPAGRTLVNDQNKFPLCIQ